MQENTARASSRRSLGNRSLKRARELFEVMRHRYLGDQETANALAVLARSRNDVGVLDFVLYFYAVQADELLQAVVLDLLWPVGTVVDTGRVIEFLRTTDIARTWSPSTRKRAAQAMLQTLRDFGTLGDMTLPLKAFAFISFVLMERTADAGRVMNDVVWKWFLLGDDELEDLFYEAHANSLLTCVYDADDMDLEFPASSLEEYAHVLAKADV